MPVCVVHSRAQSANIQDDHFSDFRYANPSNRPSSIEENCSKFSVATAAAAEEEEELSVTVNLSKSLCLARLSRSHQPEKGLVARMRHKRMPFSEGKAPPLMGDISISISLSGQHERRHNGIYRNLLATYPK
ncbi:hypothetical protein Ciccas_003293 [Cichlidogyrus casuarinus]|uniref:Uncharacterized protein n=1 Tax=Cichlidogyrus casuarinus TaxID=1844966 RepID=A0ABD2QES4_9PLAT